MLSPYYEDYMTTPISADDLRLWALLRAEISARGKNVARFWNVTHTLERFSEVYGREFEMPRKTKKDVNDGNAGKSDRPLVYWHNVKLDDADVDGAGELSGSEDRMAAMLFGLACAGHSAGWKPVDDGASCMAYIVQGNVSPGTRAVGITGYASNYPDALASVLYKYYVVLGEQFPEPRENTPSRFR